MLSSDKKIFSVAARGSLLSKVQVEEVLSELHLHHPEIEFETTWIQTKGDKDLKTSLRTLDKTDFFTQEIDNLQLAGICRIAVHSAKDLPDPLPKGLSIVALTKGVDPSDVLVLRQQESLSSLPAGARIGTSSTRREQAVLSLRKDLVCVDIRGAIQQRLEQLDSGLYDGVIIAEAALIRLRIQRPRIFLPGDTAPLQGKLAVVARDEDIEMKELFACMDGR